MNDFTKEELEQILFDMDEKIFRFDKNHISQCYLILRNKIQSLIDNYCEHDQGYEQDSCMVDICKKCKEIF